MGAGAEIKTLFHMLRGQRGATHAERLENFYSGQASNYDSFRERLLRGRGELLAKVPFTPGMHMVELGGGTGRNLEYIAETIPTLGSATVVDLTPSLLAQCNERIAARKWTNVHAVEADATTWRPPQPVDVVLCSYSLTMIPPWFAAIDNAVAMLKPGGYLCVVDFTVAGAHPAAGRARQWALTRQFWPLWFGHDGVRPNPDHMPYLQNKTSTVLLEEQFVRLPWMWFPRMLTHRFIGQKALTA